MINGGGRALVQRSKLVSYVQPSSENLATIDTDLNLTDGYT